MRNILLSIAIAYAVFSTMLFHVLMIEIVEKTNICVEKFNVDQCGISMVPYYKENK